MVEVIIVAVGRLDPKVDNTTTKVYRIEFDYEEELAHWLDACVLEHSLNSTEHITRDPYYGIVSSEQLRGA